MAFLFDSRCASKTFTSLGIVLKEGNATKKITSLTETTRLFIGSVKRLWLPRLEEAVHLAVAPHATIGYFSKIPVHIVASIAAACPKKYGRILAALEHEPGRIVTAHQFYGGRVPTSLLRDAILIRVGRGTYRLNPVLLASGGIDDVTTDSCKLDSSAPKN